MSLVQIVAILGSIPLFSLRTFLPAFLTALLLAYPEYFPGMDNVPPVPEDAFITRNWVIITLGLLSILEILGDKSTEIRNLMKNAQTYIKPVMFLLINLSLLDEASADVLREVQWAAAVDPNWLLLAFGTLTVYWLACLRRDFINFLENVDEDDNLYLNTISSWVEDSLVLFGFLLLILAGIVMVAVYAAGIAVILLLRKKYDQKLEQQKTICNDCGEKNLPFAVNCRHCQKLQPQIHRIGFFGQKKNSFITSVRKHRLNLLSHKRCPKCATKLEGNGRREVCKVCNHPVFSSPTSKEYVKYLDSRFIRITGLSFVLGFIPIAGFIISAVMANINLFTPYRRYLPKGTSFITKLFIKFLTFLFFLLGIALGFIAAPAYITLRYYIWKRRFYSVVPVKN